METEQKTPYQIQQERTIELLEKINMKLGFIVSVIFVVGVLSICGSLIALTW